jgi:hypothetical protein
MEQYLQQHEVPATHFKALLAANTQLHVKAFQTPDWANQQW